MSRVLLFAAMILCVGCGGSKPEEKAAPVVKLPPTASPHEPGTPPEFIEFPNSYGKATFTHKKHFDRVNGACDTCHPKIFPQALEPIDYGVARHRRAEEYKTSCAVCHDINGTAFAAERNCQRCHEMGPK